MANKALEILRKAEYDLDIEISMWKNQGRPEVATRCKIEKAQVKQAIEKLCAGETSDDNGALPIPDVIKSACKKPCTDLITMCNACRQKLKDDFRSQAVF